MITDKILKGIFYGLIIVLAVVAILLPLGKEAEAALISYNREPSGDPTVIESEVLTLSIDFEADTSGVCSDLATHYQWMYQIDGGGWIDIGGGSFNGTLPVSATDRSWGITTAGVYQVELRFYDTDPMGDYGSYCATTGAYEEFTLSYGEPPPPEFEYATTTEGILRELHGDLMFTQVVQIFFMAVIFFGFFFNTFTKTPR